MTSDCEHMTTVPGQASSDDHLRTVVREAVADAIRTHVCPFTSGEASNLHLVARMSPDQLDALKRVSKLGDQQLGALARLADALNAATTRMSQAVVMALFIVALWVLARFLKLGLINP